jgi:putative membrane protein
MRNTKSWITILWVLVVLLTVTRLATTAFSPSLTIPVVMAAAVFALIHGALRYRWSGVFAFLVVCLVVSNILENTSILTGFPFGHYHYTSGPKLFLVPWFIGPSYFATAYLAWTVAIVLIGDVRREGSWFTIVAVPVIASAAMVMWDLTLDPTASTIKHFWVWEQGGGYFGVPFTNYVGWFFTVYVFLQLFALFLRVRRGGREESQPLPRSYYAQAVISYAVVGLTAVLSYLVFAGNTLVTDPAGVVWQTRSITEAEATVSIYTMIFVAVLAGVKLLQASAGVRHTSLEARTGIVADQLIEVASCTR